MAANSLPTGYLLLADISGYTSLLSDTELEHASDIIQSLLTTIHRDIRPPFTFVKYEGDAVFYFLEGKEVNEGDRIIDHIEGLYDDFMSQIRDMTMNTTCRCKACRAIPSLDLKFFVHYGEFLRQKLPGSGIEIAGFNVILLHRLLKNKVSERFNTKGYALLTEPCLEKTGKPTYVMDHEEVYDDLGVIHCGMIDLSENYLKRQSEERIYLEPDDCDFIHNAILPASPEVLWNYCIDSKLRREWQGNTFSVVNIRNRENRFGVGGEAHCAHGGYRRVSRYVDLRPFHYFTMKCTYTPSLFAPPMYVIFEMTPVNETETQLSLRIRILRRDPFTMFFTKMVAPLAIKLEVNFERLKRVMREREG